jgi:hypothetical protein
MLYCWVCIRVPGDDVEFDELLEVEFEMKALQLVVIPV